MAIPRRRKVERLSVPVQVRFRASEVEILRAEADERGISLSQVIRERTLRGTG